ncbi:hypothetical protein L484_021044 [Morus notabilis]|uniref:Mitochondrial import inner membrane translocase subunit TIM50 n=1 Tax=Morus notabilis TaxID=981085 RepID=W9QIG4_9ROSA|nr:hypothetical protein L484_021044 [Morus notabilis]
MTKGEVQANNLEVKSTMRAPFVRSLEMNVEKTKNPEQLTLVWKKKTRRRNRRKKPMVVQNDTLVQELPETEEQISDVHLSIISNLSLCNGRNNKAVAIPSGTVRTLNKVNGDSGICNTSFPRLPSSRLRKKLLILDINGLLADIVSPPPKDHKADTKIARRAGKNRLFMRPACHDFLKFCFERFEDLSQCTATGFRTLENRHKTLVFKELRRLWEKHDPNLPWEKGEYNESNTLLLDDSPYKALLNPAYTSVFPHPYKFSDGIDSSLGAGGDLRVYLEELSAAKDVQKFVEKKPFGQMPITENSASWDFYLEVITATYSLPTSI